jgi:lipopolysaccharide transport system ATP-binding protein
MQAVSKLVTHCIYLENGKVIEKGEKNSVINKYLSAINKSKDKLVYVDSQTSDKPKIRKVRVNTSKPNNFQISSTPMSIEVDLAIPHQITKTCLTLRIKDNRGVACLDFSFFDTDFVCSSPGVYTLICKFPKLKLYMGKYSIDAFLAEPPGGEFFQTLENICPFEVLMFELSRGDWEWQPYNTVYLEEYDWDVKTAVFSNQE